MGCSTFARHFFFSISCPKSFVRFVFTSFMRLAACAFSWPNQRTLRFSYVLKQPEQMRERKEEENVRGAEGGGGGGGGAEEPGALWSFSLSRWKAVHSTGCIPTPQRNAEASPFLSGARGGTRGELLSLSKAFGKKTMRRLIFFGGVFFFFK